MYFVFSSGSPSTGKSDMVGTSSCFLGLPRFLPMFNAEKSGVKLLAETLEPNSISEMLSWEVWGVCGVKGVGGRLPLILVVQGVWIGVANLSSLGASPEDVL